VSLFQNIILERKQKEGQVAATLLQHLGCIFLLPLIPVMYNGAIGRVQGFSGSFYPFCSATSKVGIVPASIRLFGMRSTLLPLPTLLRSRHPVPATASAPVQVQVQVTGNRRDIVDEHNAEEVAGGRDDEEDKHDNRQGGCEGVVNHSVGSEAWRFEAKADREALCQRRSRPREWTDMFGRSIHHHHHHHHNAAHDGDGVPSYSDSESWVMIEIRAANTKEEEFPPEVAS
jgi:hypothetical protein